MYLATFFREAFNCALLMLPVALIYMEYVPGIPGSDPKESRKGGRKRIFAAYLFGAYFAEVLVLTGFVNLNSYIGYDPAMNLIPFAGIFNDPAGALLNVLLFVPLGFLLPTGWAYFRGLKRTLKAGAGMTFFIELSQLFTHRCTDINDVITNLLGTLAGYYLARQYTKKFTENTLSGTKAGGLLFFGLFAAVLVFTGVKGWMLLAVYGVWKLMQQFGLFR